MSSLKILVSLLLLSYMVIGEMTISHSDSSGNINSITFKNPTEDTTMKIRAEISLTFTDDFSDSLAFYAHCGVHDVGASLSSVNGTTGFAIFHY